MLLKEVPKLLQISSYWKVYEPYGVACTTEISTEFSTLPGSIDSLSAMSMFVVNNKVMTPLKS